MKIKEITRKFFSVQKFKISDRLTSYQILLVCLFLFAYLIRTMYGWLELPDYWGDSYHHFYIIKATLQNAFIYSDYKTNNFLWLPGIHYLGLAFLLLFGGNSLVTLHLMNRIIGAFSAILVADIVYKVFKNQYLAMISSFTVILSPWHILYSNMFMPEPWAGVCLLLMVWGWVSNSEFAFQLGWFLGIISRYENWIFGLLLLMFLLFITRTREKKV